MKLGAINHIALTVSNLDCSEVFYNALLGFFGKESNVDGEAVISFDGKVSSSDRVLIYELPRVEKMATLVHHGSYNTIKQAYAALTAWIETNGYKIIGSNREVYIIGGNEQGNQSYLTEVQFPLAKV